jgi:two-component system sensor histidine kinase GlrK
MYQHTTWLTKYPSCDYAEHPGKERSMHLRLFWCVILAQSTLIVLLCTVSLYALTQLKWLTRLSSDILVVDTICIEHEKRLLKIFLAQMRHAEKYLLLRDKAFYEQFTQNSRDFDHTLSQVEELLDTPQESTLLKQVKTLQVRYVTGFATALGRNSVWSQEKTALSDGITTGISELIRLREEAVGRKTTAARDRAAVATSMLGWLMLSGVTLAILLSYVQARGVSRPLRKLAHELLRVGTGDFQRSLDVRGPKEVGELAQAFNWMSTRLAELDRLKTDFIAHMSHELRTPLTAIQEGTALLLENTPDPITPSQREVLEVVQSHGERLSHGISAVLDLAKMEAGMMEYVWMPSDVRSLLEKSLHTIGLMAQKKHLHLEVTCPASLPLLAVDERRILQVFNNLLSNAVKFTPAHGRITITVFQWHTDGAQKGCVEVRIADTGSGIPADEVERIFDRFYQSAYHRKHNPQGTGLGLAIARHIVEAHGGKMWAESQIGQGATFIVTLPCGGDRAEKPTLLSRQSGVSHAV